MTKFYKEILVSSFGKAIDMREQFPYSVRMETSILPILLNDFLHDCKGARQIRVVEFEYGASPLAWYEIRFKDSHDAIQFKLMI